jgi:Protein of unknown function (DUF4232)
VRLTHRTGRLAAAAVACVAIGVPAVALASSSARSVAATPQCTAANTYVWLALAPNGTAGTINYPVEFTNIGTAKCTLSGFPGVAAIGKSGKKLGPAAYRTGTAHTITLRPHQTANALIGIIETGNFTGCHHATAFGLQVYPPNQKVKQIVSSFTFALCTNKPYLSVNPVKAGVGVP